MATTTKTLTPTNQTITLPDMTERPDASVLVDGIGKDADAINALSNQIYSRTFSYSNYRGDVTTYEITLPKTVTDSGTFTYLAYIRHYSSSTSWIVDEYIISVVNYVPYCTVVVKNSGVNISNAVLSNDHTKVTLTLDRTVYMQVSAITMF